MYPVESHRNLTDLHSNLVSMNGTTTMTQVVDRSTWFTVTSLTIFMRPSMVINPTTCGYNISRISNRCCSAPIALSYIYFVPSQYPRGSNDVSDITLTRSGGLTVFEQVRLSLLIESLVFTFVEIWYWISSAFLDGFIQLYPHAIIALSVWHQIT